MKKNRKLTAKQREKIVEMIRERTVKDGLFKVEKGGDWSGPFTPVPPWELVEYLELGQYRVAIFFDPALDGAI